MAIREMPLYGQLFNTCGFAASLMMLNPEGTPLAPLLNDLCAKLSLEHSPESWQISCGYLLLKALTNRRLRFALRTKLKETVDYQTIFLRNYMREKWIKANQRQNNELAKAITLFLNQQVVRKILLYEYLNETKTNLELRLLNALFGATPVLFPSPDGTGSLILSSPSEFKKNASLLDECIRNGLLLGLPGHWVAVKQLVKANDDFKLVVHDSLSGNRTIQITKFKASLHARFYAFNFSLKELRIMDRLIRACLKLRNPSY